MRGWGRGVAILCLWSGLAGAEPAELRWGEWNDQVFARARHERRFVLLEMEAVWCHWCHVMEKTTYADPQIRARLAQNYLLVKVDADARPDLANRYQDYGWPATVVFSPEGQEIVRLQGYQSPQRMLDILNNIVADPSPVVVEASPPPPPAGLMSEELREKALVRHFEHFDTKLGGYSFAHKFLNWDSVELSLTLARDGDARSARMARLTLDGQLNLIDPVWGGVYQYSTDGDWQHPHYEKIMEHQANNLRIFTLAALYFQEPRYRRAADQIAGYLLDFLRSPEGAFYVSQDADLIRGEHAQDYFALDDPGRRRLGLPAIDRHCYARENGWAAEALALYGAALQRPRALQAARQAAEWLVSQRALAGGGYWHDRQETLPFLGDSLAAGRAFLTLYSLSGEPVWLERARAAGDFIGSHFVHAEHAGLASAVARPPLDKLVYQRDENIQAARFFNLLGRYSGQPQHLGWRDQALSYLALPRVALEYNTGGVLLADRESRREPIHFTLGGSDAGKWTAQIAAYPDFYRQITRSSEPAGVLVCDWSGVCSRPFVDEPALTGYLQKLLGPAAR